MSRRSELPSSFYITGGTLPPGSPSYISRAADDELFQRCLAGEFCYVLTTRQMGKSSLMAHTAERLRKDADTTVAIVDLSQVGTEKDQENKSADRWYYGVGRMIQRSLGVEHDLKAWWREREDLPSVQRLTEFFADVVLSHAAGRVLIFVDEIDTTIGLPYSDDFFAAIRACYNSRATEPELRRLGFVLLGVASPSDLIADVRRTPFNIGHRIELTDFTFEEAMPLAQALATAEAERARQLRRILHWTGGHPYLTQRICELLAKAGPPERSDEQIDCAVANAFFDPTANRDEPNLRFVRDRLTNYGRPRRDLLRLYERIHSGEVIKDVPISPTHSALKLSGAVVATAEGTLRVRNEIYRHLFTAEWARRAMPVEWKPRLAIAASVVLLLGGFITWHWLVQPRNYVDVLMRVQDDAGLAESTAAKLRAIFGYSGRADELLANFWGRQALAAEGGEHRDEAILYRCRALQAQDTNLGRRELNAMIQDDYPRLLRTFRHTFAVGGVIFSAKGDRFLTWTQDAVQLWNTGKTADSLGPQIRAGTGKKRELGTDAAGKSTGTTEKLKGVYPGAQFTTVAFSPDGSKVLTGSVDNTARLWSAADGSPIGQPLKHEGPVLAVAFSPDGSKVLTGSFDNTARLWSAADGSPIGQPLKHEGPVLAVAFSPDGSKVLTGSGDNTARLWSAADGSPIGQPLKHEGPVRAVAFSPDGSKVITSTNLWLHIFQLRSEAVLAIASWLKPSPSFTAPFVEPSGTSVRIVTGVADGKLAIVTFEADLPTAEAITGRSEALSRDWQRRLALQFTADGKIVPAPQQ